MFSLFRISVLLALVAVLALGGYAVGQVECCHSEKTSHGEKTSQGESHHDSTNATADDGCRCVCHVGDIFHPTAPLSVGQKLISVTVYSLHWGAFPPDAVPLGIDYPPQLA